MLNDVKLNSMSAKQIRIIGMQALEEKLGVEGTIRFLERFDNGGSGDYTKEKYDVPEENYDNLVHMRIWFPNKMIKMFEWGNLNGKRKI